MDAGSTPLFESWCMRLGEHTIRTAMVALVLTGQMLPAGSVSAQDDPLPPTFAAPEKPPKSPATEATAPKPAPVVGQPIPPAAAVKPAATKAAQSPLMFVSEVAPSPVTTQDSVHTFGEWKMTIRPGSVPAKPAPRVPDPPVAALQPQATVSVPVTVTIHNLAMPSPLVWSVPSTYPTWWYAPTSAYLFQRPRPYWQLRDDFHHLQPFIAGLWY